MARGIHRLPKVSPGPAMPDLSTPCGWDTTKTALWPFLWWPTHRASGLWLSSTPLDTPRCTGLLVQVRNFYVTPLVSQKAGQAGPYGVGYPRG
jgi:hypothetical protein